MKKLTLILLTFILACGALTAEAARTDTKKLKPEKPDMEKIKKEVNDPASKYYYPKLFKMYTSNDTSMQQLRMTLEPGFDSLYSARGNFRSKN